MLHSMDIYSSLGKIDRRVIEDFSRSMNVIFPESYINLLSEYNWLRPSKDIFEFIDFKGERVDRDVNFYGYEIEAYPGSGTIIEAQNSSRNNVTIGFTGNGDFICFDYKGCDDPSIILLHHDEHNPDDKEEMMVSFVSRNFDSFIRSLRD